MNKKMRKFTGIKLSYIYALPASLNQHSVTRKRLFKTIRASIIFVFIIFLGRRVYFVFYESRGCNDFNLDIPERYYWLFDSTKINSLICEYPIGNAGAKKYKYLYTYKNQYRYFIIEDAILNSLNLDKITDTTNPVSSNKLYIDPSSENDMYWGGHILLRSKLCIDSSNRFIINIGEERKAVRNDSLHYIYFKGRFKSILMQNENYENQYLIKYDQPTQTTILFYKPKKILYLIIINAIEGFQEQENGIEFLSLK